MLLFIVLTLVSGRSHFEFGAKIIPHPSKMQKGGEDAYWANSKLLVIADGVGGWNSKGIDPSLYSRELVGYVEQYFVENPAHYILNPKQLIISSAKSSKNKGSATLVLMSIDDEGIIRSSYIGDSGYIILRPQGQSFELLFESEEQQHSFNYPFQVGNPGDDPSKAVEFIHKVQDGDIIVMGSDGLYDNVSPKMVINFLKEQMMHNDGILDVSKEARALAQYAFNYSLDKQHNSPFSIRAKQQGKRYKGGKSDDITVIISRVHIDKDGVSDL